MPDPATCGAARPDCVDSVIDGLTSRLAPHEKTCHHKAVFLLTYLGETQSFRQATDETGFFSDLTFMKQFDALFGAYFFAAFDSYASGRAESVPPAWQIAFAAADARQLTAAGDALLGINAHVNRDLPFVLDQLGAVGGDGPSRRADFEAVNTTIDRALGATTAQIAERLDPTITSSPDGLPIDPDTTKRIITGWRTEAFRNATRLAEAPTPAARAKVAARIEEVAAQTARSLQLANSYRLGQGPSTRADYCASRRRP